MAESTKFISYDLRKEGQNYEKLFDFIKSFPVHHKINESFWMVNTSLTAKKLRKKLESVTDENDRVFVVEYGNNAASSWGNPIENFKSDLVHKPSDK